MPKLVLEVPVLRINNQLHCGKAVLHKAVDIDGATLTLIRAIAKLISDKLLPHIEGGILVAKYSNELGLTFTPIYLHFRQEMPLRSSRHFRRNYQQLIGKKLQTHDRATGTQTQLNIPADQVLEIRFCLSAP